MTSAAPTKKEGNVTIYDEPAEHYTFATFVPVNNSTKVKFDPNGGGTARDAFVANGYEFGELTTIPYRKGYIFAGWWTDKTSGEHITASTVFDPALFAGQKTPTLYAHWLQLKKLTLKDDSAYAEWYLNEEDFDPELYPEIMHSIFLTNPALENGGYLEGKGVMEVLPGASVYVEVPETSEDNKGNQLVFQKWTVTPANADLGGNFRVAYEETGFTMPNADVTLQATYVDESACGLLYAGCSWNEHDFGDESLILTEYETQWSPDDGKTWYCAGDAALLKAGTYTISWRSTNPHWAAPTDKPKVTVYTHSESELEGHFTFIPKVVCEIMVDEGDGYADSSVGGTVTINPKDGLVAAGKSATLTAKATKGYAFQGWLVDSGIFELMDSSTPPYSFDETASSFKINVNSDGEVVYDKWGSSTMVNPNGEVHVRAYFKAVSAYRADEIVFRELSGNDSWFTPDSGNEVTISAYVGCALDDYVLDFEAAAYPLTYKMNGKLPAGLKFDAKQALFSGAPTKAGNYNVIVTATDPANHSVTVRVNIVVEEMPTWLAGNFRAMVTQSEDEGYWDCGDGYDDDYDCIWVEDESRTAVGMLELSVSKTGKASAKLLHQGGSTTFSGNVGYKPLCDDDGYVFGNFFYFYKENKDAYVAIYFYEDGTIDGDYELSFKNGSDTKWLYGEINGLRQEELLLADSGFINQYYTAYLYAPSSDDNGYYDDDDYYYDDYYYYYDECSSGTGIGSGFGYLTVKTDAKGGAKITGKLPDGEAVTLSALVLPIDAETARMYVFSSPSAYKKLGWFAASLTLMSDGSIISETGIFTRPYDDGTGRTEENPAEVYGALYSAAQTLEDYYFTVSCNSSEAVNMQYTFREDGESWADYVGAMTFGNGDMFFNVNLKGDKNGGITLAEKSPAPWNAGGEWNYWEDKKGNPITDPSQLSISFAKATGLFSGKATVYFDYHDGQRLQHKTASLPYSGVVLKNEEGWLDGYGAAIYKAARTYLPCYEGAKEKKYTQTVSLPVILVTGCDDCEYVED